MVVWGTLKLTWMGGCQEWVCNEKPSLTLLMVQWKRRDEFVDPCLSQELSFRMRNEINCASLLRCLWHTNSFCVFLTEICTRTMSLQLLVLKEPLFLASAPPPQNPNKHKRGPVLHPSCSSSEKSEGLSKLTVVMTTGDESQNFLILTPCLPHAFCLESAPNQFWLTLSQFPPKLQERKWGWPTDSWLKWGTVWSNNLMWAFSPPS